MNRIQIVAISLLSLICCSNHQGPVDEEGRPLIVKTGTIDCDLVETTPVVFHGRVYRFEYVRERYWDNQTGNSYFRFVDRESGEVTAPFGKGYHLGSAFVENDSVYVTAVDQWGGEKVYLFSSADMEQWNQRLVFELPTFGIFNTSLTRADDQYVLMFEIGKPSSYAGVGFTALFAVSTDLRRWEILPAEHNYAKDRYTAPHCLRYLNSWYYNFFLEAHEGYEMRVVRSRDLIHWEASPLNPVLKASAEDKQIANNQLTPALQEKIDRAENINNSDFDFCEHRGMLVINYSWGNQNGAEFLSEAFYNGTMEQFLKGWFPE